jgi:hypothetical protein
VRQRFNSVGRKLSVPFVGPFAASWVLICYSYVQVRSPHRRWSFSHCASAELGTRAAAEQAIVLVAREWLHRYTQLTNQSSSFPA